MHYQQEFTLSEKCGNNDMSFEKRTKFHGHSPYLIIPKLIEGDLNDVKIGNKVVFEDYDFDDKLISGIGLENFVKYDYKCELNGIETNIPVYIFDNHNHALYFWYKELIEGTFNKGASLIHVDQHSDMVDPGIEININKEKDLDYIWELTNLKINVGNYIVPALGSGIIGECIQIRSGESLKYDFNLDGNSQKPEFDLSGKDIILNIDLDFWVPELDHIGNNKKYEFIKRLLPYCKTITIASSPFFIKQELAIEVLHKIFE